MAKTYEKRALMTGAGALFVDFMETEATSDTPPTYAGAVVETPSLNTLDATFEVTETQVYLSNLLHDDLSAVRSATISLEAGYLPRDFAEEAQGKVKIGGSWAMPTNPVKKPFRLAVPFTDSNGDEYIVNFPNCTLSPVDISGQTQGEEATEQLKSFNIIARPLPYNASAGDKTINPVVLTMDMADPENKSQYDRDDLLESGWFDETSLAGATSSTGGA